jgi:hypothetical protein
MATWHDLPSELHHLILYYFCASLVEDLIVLGETVWDCVDPNYIWEHDLIEWPKSPQSLSSYFSALLTCQLFHRIITGVVNIDGESIPDALQRVQRENVHQILERLYDEVSSGIVHINLFYFAAGCFWRNSQVFGEVDLLMKVLCWTSQKSRLMLIPHLESWLLRHASLAASENVRIELLPVDDGDDDFVFARLKTGSLNIKWDDLVVSKVSGVAENGNEESEENHPPCDPELPLLRDIREASLDSWWLFPSYNFGSNDDDDEWTLVDYGQQKIYSGSDGTSSYCWKENIWDVERWRRDQALGTLGDSDASHNKTPNEWHT